MSLFDQDQQIAPRRALHSEAGMKDGCDQLLPTFFPFASSGFESLALGHDALQQLIPGLDERSRSFYLKLAAQSLNVNAGLGELGQHFITFAGTRRDAPVNLPVVG